MKSAMLSIAVYDRHVEQLFQRIQQIHNILSGAKIAYRIVGGMAVFIHVSERDPLRARLTADVDVAIDRNHFAAFIEAAQAAGWAYRHVAGVDMLMDKQQPRARSAVHIIFLNEKVRPHYLEAVPGSSPVKTGEGVYVASVADLVLMKLTSYRLKDRVHLQDLDAVGLISEEVEAQLSDAFRMRLVEVRASE